MQVELQELRNIFQALPSFPPAQVDRFYVVGHSMGGAWALQVAACFRDRVLGCVSLSGLADLHHPSLKDKALAKEVKGHLPGFVLSVNKPGCGGAFARCLFNAMGAAEYHADKTKDWGFASKYTNTMKGKEDGGDERAFSVTRMT